MAQRFLVWYWSATGGGGSQFAVRLAQRLALRFGADAVTLSLHVDDPGRSTAERLGLKHRAAAVATARLKPFATLAGLGQAARVLAAHASEADCVILPMNFAAAAPLSFTLRKPLVYFAHDPEPHPGDYARGWQRATQAVLVQRSVRVAALSQYAREMLARQGVAKAKVVCAPLSAVFAPAPPRGDRREGPLRLLCAGRMMAYKGLDLLAEALDQIKDRDDWRLIVAGEGPALTPAVRARLQRPQVRVQEGWMGEADLDALIAECDVFVAPYRSATQSGVIAQALARGKPCVVTPVGALAEQIDAGAAGFVAARADADALGAALTGLLDDPVAQLTKAEAAHRLAHDAWHADHWAGLLAL